MLISIFNTVKHIFKYHHYNTYLGLKNTFITITAPNHYGIVTGLFEENHGIVANSFYDPVLNERLIDAFCAKLTIYFKNRYLPFLALTILQLDGKRIQRFLAASQSGI